MTSTQLLMTLRGGTAISIIFLASRWWILPKEMGTQSSTCIFVCFFQVSLPIWKVRSQLPFAVC